MEMHLDIRRQEINAEKHYEKLKEMSSAILPELLAYLKKNNPEAAKKLIADLEEIDRKYPDDDD